MLNHNSPVPLYHQLAERLKRQIEAGEIAQGEKLPSESEMMKQYGIGRLTVRGALSQLVNMGYLEKQHGRGTFCVYAPAPPERRSIEVLLDIQDTYFIPYYLRSIAQVLDEAGCNMLVGDTEDSDARICAHLERILLAGADGVILQPPHRSGPPSPRLMSCFQALDAQRIPWVMIDSAYELEGASYLRLDEVRGGRLAAEYLIELGHVHSALLYREGYRDSQMRREGFLGAYQQRGLPAPEQFAYASGVCARLLAGLDRRQFTAVFCYNDEMAIELMQTLKREGIQVPGQLSVMGFDDSLLAPAVEPALTSVAHPKQILGERTARTLIGMMEHSVQAPCVELFEPYLVKRSSCAAV